MSKTRLLTQEEFEWMAIEAGCLEDRTKELEEEIHALNKSAGLPCVDTLEEARAVAQIIREKEEAIEDLKGLAEAMLEAGVPDQIWIKFTNGGKKAKLKVWCTAGNANMRVEKA